MLSNSLSSYISELLKAEFGVDVQSFEFQATRKDFEGDITLVVFPLLKLIKGNPVEIGNRIGQYLVDHSGLVTSFNVVGGFLNLVISDAYYLSFFNEIKDDSKFGFVTPSDDAKAIMVEYASPNTNKPLHLGHIRNILLGYSVAEILKAAGNKVYKTQIINDRGIHICKSMVAWSRFGEGATPESTRVKGDKLVGNYYVAFENELRQQAEIIYKQYRARDYFSNMTVSASKVDAHNNVIDNCLTLRAEVIRKLPADIFNLLELPVISFITQDEMYFTNLLKRLKKDDNDKTAKFVEREFKEILTLEDKIAENISAIREVARNRTEIMGEAQKMLRDWEAGDPDVIALWKTMNQWVYDGFDATFESLGVGFDKNYYESDTYLLGKSVVELGLEKGIFERDPDGSVWIDLTAEGLDRKIVLRSDGTAVYMTQDIGTAIQRVKDFPDVSGMVYTVGNEQDYHFKVLFLILKKLGFDWAENLFHLSYGMVDLPSGKMKSREGTVVDADDLIEEMVDTARQISEELGKLDGYTDAEKAKLFHTIGMGALKYYILKVDPKKRILFNPAESVDFAGNTGPFIQYTYARIQSILRKAGEVASTEHSGLILHPKEKELLKQLSGYPQVISEAAQNHSPALIANYTYELVKEYNSFYQSVSILGEVDLTVRNFRVAMSRSVANVIASAFGLLGIGVPERM